MVVLAPEPAQKGALQVFCVEPTGLRTPVFARYGHTRGMNNMSFDIPRSEPTRQPKAVTASFVGNRDACDNQEMRDPILRGRESLRNPCDLVGPRSLTFYWRTARDLSSAIRAMIIQRIRP